jgi:hypothetical protein
MVREELREPRANHTLILALALALTPVLID